MNPRKILQHWILPDGGSLLVSDEGEQKRMPMLVNASVSNAERNDREGLQRVIRTKSFPVRTASLRNVMLEFLFFPPAQFCARKCHIYPPCTPPYLFARDSFALGENYCMHRFSSIIHLCSQQPAFNTEIPQTLARNYHSTPSNRCIPARGGPDGVKKHEPRRHGFWATLKHERILITPHQASVRGSEIGNVKCLIFRRKHQ